MHSEGHFGPRRRNQSTCLALFACMALTCTHQSRAAASPSRVKEGKAALVDSRFDDAKTIFKRGLQEADEGPPRWQMLLGLALAYELSDEFKPAVEHYRAFVVSTAQQTTLLSEKWHRRRRKAQHDIRRLEPHVLSRFGRLDIQSEPSGASVTIDGQHPQLGGTTPYIHYVTPATHIVRISHRGYEPVVLHVSVEQGQQITLHKALTATHEPTPVPNSTATPISTSDEVDPSPASKVTLSPGPLTQDVVPNSELLPLGISGMAVGVTALVSAVVVTTVAFDDADKIKQLQHLPATKDNIARDDALRDRVAVYQPLYTGLYIAGAGLTAVGASLLVIHATTANASIEASIQPGPGLIGLRWSQRF